MLEKLFKLSEHGTTIKTEVTAGLTTFLTMAYIIFVNPAMLAEAGMDQGAVFVATCIAAAIGCFIMGFIANYPIALAPGMGLNAFFTYGVVLGMGYSWQAALGAVFLSGIIFLLLSIFKVREWIINAIPKTLKLGIATGIGSFLALIALKNAGIIVSHPATFVALGDITEFVPLMSIIGFFLIAAFTARNWSGAVMFAILIMTLVGLLFGDVEYAGIMSLPPSIAPTFMQMDLKAALEISMLSVVFAFLFVDLFDTSGTLIAVTQRAGLTDEKGNIERLGKALSSDSIATLSGAALGTSTTTSYIESASGVAAGGRTGLTAVVVGLLFVLSIFFSPLAGMIPVYATTGAIFYVAILMLFNLKQIDWDDITEAAPVTVVLLFTPLTFSIAHGITLAFITYTFTKALCGKANEVSTSVWILTALFIAKIIFVG
ncbi:MAG: NCS2 family permease [Gammaproteobacteria bacterium]|nr:NCS2 family permease [Gammaproteobacteria bacterium]